MPLPVAAPALVVRPVEALDGTKLAESVTVACPYCLREHAHPVTPQPALRDAACTPGGQYTVDCYGALKKPAPTRRWRTLFEDGARGPVRTFDEGEEPELLWRVGNTPDVQAWADEHYPDRYVANFFGCTARTWTTHHSYGQLPYDFQEVVEFRNFRGQIPVKQMCGMVDWQPCHANEGHGAGAKINVRAKVWIITGPKPPAEWYASKDKDGHFKRLLHKFGRQIPV